MAFKKKKTPRVANDDNFDFDSFDGDIDLGGSDDSFGEDFSLDGQDEDPFGGQQAGGKKGGRKGGRRGGKSGGAGGVIGVIVAVLAVVIIGGAIISLFIGPTIGDCKKVAARFEEGCNEMDFYKLADCLAPSYRTPVKAVITVASLSDDDIDKVVTMIDQATGGVLGDAAEETSTTLTQIFRQVKVEPIRIDLLPGKTRSMKCKLTAGVFDVYIKVTVAKSNGEAYISSVQLAK